MRSRADAAQVPNDLTLFDTDLHLSTSTSITSTSSIGLQDWHCVMTTVSGMFDLVGRFMKADDDTYVVVKNLRTYLSQFDPSTEHFLGETNTLICCFVVVEDGTLQAIGATGLAAIDTVHTAAAAMC